MAGVVPPDVHERLVRFTDEIKPMTKRLEQMLRAEANGTDRGFEDVDLPLQIERLKQDIAVEVDYRYLLEVLDTCEADASYHRDAPLTQLTDGTIVGFEVNGGARLAAYIGRPGVLLTPFENDSSTDWLGSSRALQQKRADTAHRAAVGALNGVIHERQRREAAADFKRRDRERARVRDLDRRVMFQPLPIDFSIDMELAFKSAAEQSCLRCSGHLIPSHGGFENYAFCDSCTQGFHVSPEGLDPLHYTCPGCSREVPTDPQSSHARCSSCGTAAVVASSGAASAEPPQRPTGVKAMFRRKPDPVSAPLLARAPRPEVTSAIAHWKQQLATAAAELSAVDPTSWEMWADRLMSLTWLQFESPSEAEQRSHRAAFHARMQEYLEEHHPFDDWGALSATAYGAVRKYGSSA